MGFQNLGMFIVLSETLNLRQASERLQVSPQYLSRYLADLEQEYQVRLFYRKPRFCLTYEGELMLKAARDIQMHERNLESELQDLSVPENPELHVGYSRESIRVILPRLLSNYHRFHPSVKIQVVEKAEDTQLTMLENGQLDLCLGIKLAPAPKTESFPLPKEDVFLLISDELLRTYFPNDYPLCAERFYRGIRLEEFSGLPFLNNKSERFLFQKAEEYSLSHGFSFRYALSSGSTEALMSLCQKGIGCLLCTMRHIPHQRTANAVSDQYTYSFPVKDLLDDYHLDILYLKKRHLPRYVIDFIHCAKALFDPTVIGGEMGREDRK